METNKARKYNSNLIKQLLEEITPLEKLKTENKMRIAVHLDEYIKARGNQVSFAKEVGKQKSVISKWLSGFNDFTIDTLTEISYALGIDFSELTKPTPQEVIKETRVVADQPAMTIHTITVYNVLDRDNRDHRDSERITLQGLGSLNGCLFGNMSHSACKSQYN